MGKETTPETGSEHASDDAEVIGVPVRHRVPEGQAMVFANTMVVQHTADEFLLSFFQVAPPILAGAPSDQRSQLEELGGVDAYCVARIVITPGHMERVVEAINGNWERYRQTAGLAKLGLVGDEQ